MNKKGYSTGWAWILVLVILFGVGIFWGVMEYAQTTYILPTASDLISNHTMLNATEKQESLDEINKWNNYYMMTPIIMFFIILLFGVIRAVRSRTVN